MLANIVRYPWQCKYTRVQPDTVNRFACTVLVALVEMGRLRENPEFVRVSAVAGPSRVYRKSPYVSTCRYRYPARDIKITTTRLALVLLTWIVQSNVTAVVSAWRKDKAPKTLLS